MSAEDARLAVEHGVDALIVSNHGGRQLDGLPAAMEVLPEIVEAVQGRAEVILDGGVRRGADVVKALALGARACMIGRPYLTGWRRRAGRRGAGAGDAAGRDRPHARAARPPDPRRAGPHGRAPTPALAAGLSTAAVRPAPIAWAG